MNRNLMDEGAVVHPRAPLDYGIGVGPPPQKPVNKPSALNVARGLDPRLGGTSVSIPAIARYTRETNRCEAALAVFRTSDDRGGTEQTGLPASNIYEIPWNPYAPTQVIGAYRQLSSLIRSHDVLQVHGIWQSHTAMAGHLARAMKKPYIVSAHGMLDSWALTNKRWKKAVYSTLMERGNLQSATCLRALTRREADNYRAFGLRVPIAVIPNGVAILEDISPDAFFERWPNLRGKRIVLFLSRIHYKKGLDILCRAWNSIARDSDDLHLVLAGPDSENTQIGIEKLIQETGIEQSVTFTGMLESEMKWSALSASTLFVLPSYSEGFSVAILEALAAARPVVITKQCNFPELEGRDFAGVIEPVAAELERALRTFLQLPAAVIARYGHAARQYVRQQYSWASMGNAMADVYLWMLNGTAPSRVEMIRS